MHRFSYPLGRKHMYFDFVFVLISDFLSEDAIYLEYVVWKKL